MRAWCRAAPGAETSWKGGRFEADDHVNYVFDLGFVVGDGSGDGVPALGKCSDDLTAGSDARIEGVEFGATDVIRRKAAIVLVMSKRCLQMDAIRLRRLPEAGSSQFE